MRSLANKRTWSHSLRCADNLGQARRAIAQMEGNLERIANQLDNAGAQCDDLTVEMLDWRWSSLEADITAKGVELDALQRSYAVALHYDRESSLEHEHPRPKLLGVSDNYAESRVFDLAFSQALGTALPDNLVKVRGGYIDQHLWDVLTLPQRCKLLS